MSTTLRTFATFATLGTDGIAGGTAGREDLWSPTFNLRSPTLHEARSLARRGLRQILAFCDDPRHAVRARLCQLEREAAARARTFGRGATAADEELSAQLSSSMAVLLGGLDSSEAADVLARWSASPHGCCRRAAEMILATRLEAPAPESDPTAESPAEREDPSVVIVERRRRTGQAASRAPSPARRSPTPAMRGRSPRGPAPSARAADAPARR